MGGWGGARGGTQHLTISSFNMVDGGRLVVGRARRASPRPPKVRH